MRLRKPNGFNMVERPELIIFNGEVLEICNRGGKKEKDSDQRGKAIAVHAYGRGHLLFAPRQLLLLRKVILTEDEYLRCPDQAGTMKSARLWLRDANNSES
jgi:hypothetical protein